MMIQFIEQYVKNKLMCDNTGHDWAHTNRVRNLAVSIAKQEQANVMICELAALLHDVIDDKLVDNVDEQKKDIEALLVCHGVSVEDVHHILNIMSTMSFSYQLEHHVEPSLEGKIVQDSDRLDAMGAIGIARTLMYGATKNSVLYDENILPVQYKSKREYRQANSTIINHFYEKLLLLKDKMHTVTAKQMAEHRHCVMLAFLDDFKQEWHGYK